MTDANAPLRRPRAILFDWDNTLVDSWATIHEALNFLMRAMDKPEWSLAETRERVRLSLREAFPPLFGERWEEARAQSARLAWQLGRGLRVEGDDRPLLGGCYLAATGPVLSSLTGSDACDGVALRPVRVDAWRGLVFVNVDAEVLVDGERVHTRSLDDSATMALPKYFFAIAGYAPLDAQAQAAFIAKAQSLAPQYRTELLPPPGAGPAV